MGEPEDAVSRRFAASEICARTERDKDAGPKASWAKSRAENAVSRRFAASDIEIGNFGGVCLNELPPRLDLVAH